jgi:3-hydroxy-D-aspartate aldolase
VSDGDEPRNRGSRDRRCRIEGAGLRLGPALVCDEPTANYERASDERGRLGISGATNRLQIGDKICLVPGHCDPTVNLYGWYVGIRAGRVEQLWPITARGAVY